MNWGILVFTSIVLLLVGHTIHGHPSEAYAAAYVVPVMILLAFVLDRVSRVLSVPPIATALVIALTVYQVKYLLTHQFMTYGTPLSVELEVAKTIKQLSHGQPVALRTQGPDSAFPSSVDHYRYLLWYLGQDVTDQAPVSVVVAKRDVAVIPLNTRVTWIDDVMIAWSQQ